MIEMIKLKVGVFPLAAKPRNAKLTVHVENFKPESNLPKACGVKKGRSLFIFQPWKHSTTIGSLSSEMLISSYFGTFIMDIWYAGMDLMQLMLVFFKQ